MTRFRFLLHVLTVPLLLMSWGCAASLDAVPIGTWKGEGQWHNPTKTGADGSKPEKGTYTVVVTTARPSVDDARPLALEIVANHPGDSAFPHRCVYVLLALTAGEKRDDGRLTLTPYVELGNQDRSRPEGIDASAVKNALGKKAAPPATLSQAWGTTTLEIRYFAMDEADTPDFTETYSFSGDRLVKKGIFKSRENPDEVIEWTETLHKVK